MTPCEKVAQLLALARSTLFVEERESTVRLARTLFNKPSYTREITTRPDQLHLRVVSDHCDATALPWPRASLLLH